MENISYQQIFKQKDYCKIIIANMINRFGDSIDAIAFTWLVYAVTGSASWSAIMFALNMFPTIVLQPFAGPIVERINKKTVMVVSDMIRGCIVVALAVMYLNGNSNPWVLAAFTLAISSVEAFCLPASTAIIPLVLEEKFYEHGIALNSALTTVLQLVGTAVAGVIIGAFGVETAIFMDGATFFASAVIKMMINRKEQVDNHPISDTASQYFENLKAGFFYMKKNKILVHFCFLTFLVNAMMVPVTSLLAPLVSDVLGEGQELLSVIGTASVIGMGIGSAVFPYISKKGSVRNLVLIYGLGLAMSGIVLPLGSIVKGNSIAVYTISALSTIGIGFFASVISTMINVQFLKCVEQDFLARAQSMLGAGAVAAMPLTSILLGIMVNYVSVKVIMIAGSTLCAILFIVIRIVNIKFEEEYEAEN